MTWTSDRNAILSRRARLVALSLTGAGLSLQGARLLRCVRDAP